MIEPPIDSDSEDDTSTFPIHRDMLDWGRIRKDEEWCELAGGGNYLRIESRYFTADRLLIELNELNSELEKSIPDKSPEDLEDIFDLYSYYDYEPPIDYRDRHTFSNAEVSKIRSWLSKTIRRVREYGHPQYWDREIE